MRPAATTYSSMTELETIVSEALKGNKPVLHHLNADTTWLLQLPIPASSTPTPTSTSSSPQRKWYNIILDPWLAGPQSDVASWFSRQWHAIEPAYSDVEDVETLCRTVEQLSNNTSDLRDSIVVDAIAISHEFTDHCHKDTLVQFPPETTVIASTKAAALISGWKHFERVFEAPTFSGEGSDWRELGQDLDGALPDWIGIGRVVNTQDALYYHSAILIAFQLDPSSTAQALIYTPHGIHADSLGSVVQAKPELETLAILHGLHDISIDWGQQLNLGAVNGLKAQQILDGKYWIGTHDEVKKGGGLVSWLLRRKVYTVGDVLDEADKEADGRALGRGMYVDLENGRSLVLT